MPSDLDAVLDRFPELRTATRSQRVAFLAAKLDEMVRDAARALA